MKIQELKKFKKILILGYGKEGRTTEKFLKKFCPASIVGIADQKDGPDYLKKQQDYDLVIKTPGIPKGLVSSTYTTATNIFLANIKNTVIGVTGTKGKSTTASLIHSIITEAGFKSHLLGNIGKPALEIFWEQTKNTDIFVCELSSYQLDDIRYSPHISVVLDLYPEHMNYHGHVEKYFQAKKNIINFVKKRDYFVYNQTFERLKLWARETNCHVLPFEKTIPLKNEEIPLIGEHNRDNIKAAVTVAHILKISNKVIADAIKKFRPLPHRLQYVGTYSGIIFYDDAISTTPESTIFAIKSLKKIGTIFLGGLDRGYNFSELMKTVMAYKIPNIVFFPESGQTMLSLISKSDQKKLKILATSSMEKAVKFAYKYTRSGTICLLSTASPSYSLWKNFEEKGSLFQFFIKSLINDTKT